MKSECKEPGPDDFTGPCHRDPNHTGEHRAYRVGWTEPFTWGTGAGVDWQHVAVQLFRADGHCRLLTTPERDALLVAVAAAPAPDPLMPIGDAMAHGDAGAVVGAVVAVGASLADVHPFVD